MVGMVIIYRMTMVVMVTVVVVTMVVKKKSLVTLHCSGELLGDV